eukprot:3754959-Prorocentrum_lima.AAC.1
MTSSLVGSEMCIRDSHCLARCLRPHSVEVEEGSLTGVVQVAFGVELLKLLIMVPPAQQAEALLAICRSGLIEAE